MKNSKWIPKCADEINKLAEDHLEAILAIYSAAYDDGVQAGKCNALMGVSIGAIIGVIGLCIVGIKYLEHKEQL